MFELNMCAVHTVYYILCALGTVRLVNNVLNTYALKIEDEKKMMNSFDS